mgnify:CR=1
GHLGVERNLRCADWLSGHRRTTADARALSAGCDRELGGFIQRVSSPGGLFGGQKRWWPWRCVLHGADMLAHLPQQ